MALRKVKFNLADKIFLLETRSLWERHLLIAIANYWSVDPIWYLYSFSPFSYQTIKNKWFSKVIHSLKSNSLAAYLGVDKCLNIHWHTKTWIYLTPYVCTEGIFDSRPFMYNKIFLKKLLKKLVAHIFWHLLHPNWSIIWGKVIL